MKTDKYSDGYSCWCNACRRPSKQYYVEYRKANKAKFAGYQAKYVSENKETVKQSKHKWYAANPKHQLALTRKYQASKLNATPSWLTKAQLAEITEFYKNCPDGYHVDHIEPLQGKDRSGLHVLWNLQYLPAAVNQRKGNRT